jgi:hypothetical protein
VTDRRRTTRPGRQVPFKTAVDRLRRRSGRTAASQCRDSRRRARGIRPGGHPCRLMSPGTADRRSRAAPASPCRRRRRLTRAIEAGAADQLPPHGVTRRIGARVAQQPVPQRRQCHDTARQIQCGVEVVKIECPWRRLARRRRAGGGKRRGGRSVSDTLMSKAPVPEMVIGDTAGDARRPMTPIAPHGLTRI